MNILGFFAMLYLAVEPWSRRLWPHAMVTWARVLAGRIRDPLVGRDVLVVVACVTLDYALQRLIQWAAGWYLEPADLSPSFGFNLANLLGGRAMAASMLTPFVTGIAVGISWFAVLLFARVVFRRTWLAAVVYLAVWGLAYGAPRAVAGDWADVLQWCLELGFLLFLTLRFGLFAAGVFSTLSLLIDQAVLTHDFGAWYGQSSLVATLVLATVALYGFYTALGGRPLASLAAEQPS